MKKKLFFNRQLTIELGFVKQIDFRALTFFNFERKNERNSDVRNPQKIAMKIPWVASTVRCM